MTEMILFGSLNFVNWNLFVIWCLEFGAYRFYSSFSAFFFNSSKIFRASRGVS